MDNSSGHNSSPNDGSRPQCNRLTKISARRLSMTNETNAVSASPSGNKENKNPLVTVLSEDFLDKSSMRQQMASTSVQQPAKQSLLSKFAMAEVKGTQKGTKVQQTQRRAMEMEFPSVSSNQHRKSPITMPTTTEQQEQTGCDIKSNNDESSGLSKLKQNKPLMVGINKNSSKQQKSANAHDTIINNDEDNDNDQVLPVWPSRFDAASLEPSTIQHQVYSLKDYSQVSGPSVATNSSSRLLKSMSQDRKVETSAKRMSECLISSSGHVIGNYLAGPSSGSKGGKLQLIGGKHRNPSVTSHQIASSASNFISMGSQATSVQSLLAPPTAASSKSGSSTTLLSESRIDRMRKLFVSPLSLRAGGGGSGAGGKHAANQANDNPRLSFQAASGQKVNVKPHHHIMHAMYRSRGHHSRRSPLRVQQKQAAGVKSFRVYGCPLQMANNIYPITCFGRPDIYKQQSVPYILARLCNYIEETSAHLTHEGIFRVSGNARLMEKLRTLFDRLGDAPLESESVDVATSASMLKMYLRELPEPLIPTRMNYHFITLAKKYSSLLSKDSLSNFTRASDNPTSLGPNTEQSSVAYTSENNPSGGSSGGGGGSGTGTNSSIDRQRMAFLRDLTKLVRKLPIENYNLLKYLACFLYRISLKQQYNKMCAEALGIVFGPNVFRIRSESYKGLKEQELSNQIMASIISNYKTIFDCELTDPLGNLIRSNESLHRIHLQETEARSLAKKMQQESSSHDDHSKATTTLNSPKLLHASATSSSANVTVAATAGEQAKLLPTSRCPKHGHRHAAHHHGHRYYGSDEEARVAAGLYAGASDEDEDEDEDEEVDVESETDDDGADVEEEEEDDDDDLVEDCDEESYSPSSASESYCSSLDSNTVESIYEGDIEGEQYDEEDEEEDDEAGGLDYASDDDDLDEEDLGTRSRECDSETSYTPSSSHEDSDVDPALNEYRSSSFDSSSSIGRRRAENRRSNQIQVNKQEPSSAMSCRVCKRRESAQLEANKLRLAAAATPTSTSTKELDLQEAGLDDTLETAFDAPLGTGAEIAKCDLDKRPVTTEDDKLERTKADVSSIDATAAPITPQIVEKKTATTQSRGRDSLSAGKQSTLRASRRSRHADAEAATSTSRLPSRRQQQLRDESTMMTSSDNALDQQRKSRLMFSHHHSHRRTKEDRRLALLGSAGDGVGDVGGGNSARSSGMTGQHQRQHHQSKHSNHHTFYRRRSSSASSLLHIAALPTTSMVRHERRKRSVGRDDQKQQPQRARGQHSIRRKFHDNSNARVYNGKSRNRAHLTRRSEHSKLPAVGLQSSNSNQRVSIVRNPTEWKKGDYYVPESLLDLQPSLRDDLILSHANELGIDNELTVGDSLYQLRSYNSDETLLRSQEFAASATKSAVDDYELADAINSAFKPKQRRRFSGQDCLQSATDSGTVISSTTLFERICENQSLTALLDLDDDNDNVDEDDDDDLDDEKEHRSADEAEAQGFGDTMRGARGKCEAASKCAAESASVISLLDDQLTNFCHSALSLNAEHSDPLVGQVKATRQLVKSLKRLLKHGLANGYSAELASILMKLTSDLTLSDYLDDYSACFVDYLSAKSVLQLMDESSCRTIKNDSPQIDKTIQEQLCILLQQKIAMLKRRHANLKYIYEHYHRYHMDTERSKGENMVAAGGQDGEPLIQLDDEIESKSKAISDQEASSSFGTASFDTQTILDSDNMLTTQTMQQLSDSERPLTTSATSSASTTMLDTLGAVGTPAAAATTKTSSRCKFGTLCPVEFVFNIEKQLASKRALGSRVIKLNEMNLLQLQSEKLELQKNLLRFEHWFRRPTTKLEYQIVGHLYERYRAVKIIKQRRQQQHQLSH